MMECFMQIPWNAIFSSIKYYIAQIYALKPKVCDYIMRKLCGFSAVENLKHFIIPTCLCMMYEKPEKCSSEYNPLKLSSRLSCKTNLPFPRGSFWKSFSDVSQKVYFNVFRLLKF